MCADTAEQVQVRVLLAQAVKELKGYRYSTSLFCWYKSTNTDAKGGAGTGRMKLFWLCFLRHLTETSLRHKLSARML